MRRHLAATLTGLLGALAVVVVSTDDSHAQEKKSEGFDPIYGQPLQAENPDSLQNLIDAQSMGRMVWKTVTTPSGRTFQVLEPAGPPPPRPGAAEDQTATRNAVPAGQPSSTQPATPGTNARRPGTDPGTAENPTFENWVATGLLPRITSFGVYGGYASTAGFQITMPTDGTLAFRTGLTGFPGLGWLWTPGMELRFGQTPGTYNSNSSYFFSNLFIGESTRKTPDEMHWGLESGLGYRWILPDRRSVRWVAAIEVGAHWEPESISPTEPAIRAFWMIAAP